MDEAMFQSRLSEARSTYGRHQSMPLILREMFPYACENIYYSVFTFTRDLWFQANLIRPLCDFSVNEMNYLQDVIACLKCLALINTQNVVKMFADIRAEYAKIEDKGTEDMKNHQISEDFVQFLREFFAFFESEFMSAETEGHQWNNNKLCNGNSVELLAANRELEHMMRMYNNNNVCCWEFSEGNLESSLQNLKNIENAKIQEYKDAIIEIKKGMKPSEYNTRLNQTYKGLECYEKLEILIMNHSLITKILKFEEPATVIKDDGQAVIRQHTLVEETSMSQ